MQRFFAAPEQIDEEALRITLTGPDVNHIRNVLRMKPGGELWVSNGEAREYHCTILSLSDREVVLEILYAQEPDYELPCRITLFQGLPKSDKMELIIQKAVELGASAIVPVAMQRCVTKLDPKKAAKKTERWNQIAESAAKQSRRIRIPRVFDVMSYKEALSMAGQMDVILLPYEMARGMEETRRLLASIKPGQSIGILIGPEGGFDPLEVEQAREAGAGIITLGRRILRTETAGLAILSVLMFQLDEET